MDEKLALAFKSLENGTVVKTIEFDRRAHVLSVQTLTGVTQGGTRSHFHVACGLTGPNRTRPWCFVSEQTHPSAIPGRLHDLLEDQDDAFFTHFTDRSVRRCIAKSRYYAAATIALERGAQGARGEPVYVVSLGYRSWSDSEDWVRAHFGGVRPPRTEPQTPLVDQHPPQRTPREWSGIDFESAGRPSASALPSPAFHQELSQSQELSQLHEQIDTCDQAPRSDEPHRGISSAVSQELQQEGEAPDVDGGVDQVLSRDEPNGPNGPNFAIGFAGSQEQRQEEGRAPGLNGGLDGTLSIQGNADKKLDVPPVSLFPRELEKTETPARVSGPDEVMNQRDPAIQPDPAVRPDPPVQLDLAAQPDSPIRPDPEIQKDSAVQLEPAFQPDLAGSPVQAGSPVPAVNDQQAADGSSPFLDGPQHGGPPTSDFAPHTLTDDSEVINQHPSPAVQPDPAEPDPAVEGDVPIQSSPAEIQRDPIVQQDMEAQTDEPEVQPDPAIDEQEAGGRSSPSSDKPQQAQRKGSEPSDFVFHAMIDVTEASENPRVVSSSVMSLPHQSEQMDVEGSDRESTSNARIREAEMESPADLQQMSASGIPSPGEAGQEEPRPMELDLTTPIDKLEAAVDLQLTTTSELPSFHEPGKQEGLQAKELDLNMAIDELEAEVALRLTVTLELPPSHKSYETGQEEGQQNRELDLDTVVDEPGLIDEPVAAVDLRMTATPEISSSHEPGQEEGQQMGKLGLDAVVDESEAEVDLQMTGTPNLSLSRESGDGEGPPARELDLHMAIEEPEAAVNTHIPASPESENPSTCRPEHVEVRPKSSDSNMVATSDDTDAATCPRVPTSPENPSTCQPELGEMQAKSSDSKMAATSNEPGAEIHPNQPTSPGKPSICPSEHGEVQLEVVRYSTMHTTSFEPETATHPHKDVISDAASPEKPSTYQLEHGEPEHGEIQPEVSDYTMDTTSIEPEVATHPHFDVISDEASPERTSTYQPAHKEIQPEASDSPMDGTGVEPEGAVHTQMDVISDTVREETQPEVNDVAMCETSIEPEATAHLQMDAVPDNTWYAQLERGDEPGEARLGVIGEELKDTIDEPAPEAPFSRLSEQGKAQVIDEDLNDTTDQPTSENSLSRLSERGEAGVTTSSFEEAPNGTVDEPASKSPVSHHSGRGEAQVVEEDLKDTIAEPASETPRPLSHQPEQVGTLEAVIEEDPNDKSDEPASEALLSHQSEQAETQAGDSNPNDTIRDELDQRTSGSGSESPLSSLGDLKWELNQAGEFEPSIVSPIIDLTSSPRDTGDRPLTQQEPPPTPAIISISSDDSANDHDDRNSSMELDPADRLNSPSVEGSGQETLSAAPTFNPDNSLGSNRKRSHDQYDQSSFPATSAHSPAGAEMSPRKRRRGEETAPADVQMESTKETYQREALTSSPLTVLTLDDEELEATPSVDAVEDGRRRSTRTHTSVSQQEAPATGLERKARQTSRESDLSSLSSRDFSPYRRSPPPLKVTPHASRSRSSKARRRGQRGGLTATPSASSQGWTRQSRSPSHAREEDVIVVATGPIPDGAPKKRAVATGPIPDDAHKKRVAAATDPIIDDVPRKSRSGRTIKEPGWLKADLEPFG